MIVALLPAGEHGLLRPLQAQRAAACPGAMRNVRVQRGATPCVMIVIAVFFGVSFGVDERAHRARGRRMDRRARPAEHRRPSSGGCAGRRSSTMSVCEDGLRPPDVPGGAAAHGGRASCSCRCTSRGTSSARRCTSSGYQYFYIVLWALWPVLASRERAGGLDSGLGAAVHPAGPVRRDRSPPRIAAARAWTPTWGWPCSRPGVIFAILIIALFALGSGTASTGWGLREAHGGGRRRAPTSRRPARASPGAAACRRAR